MVSTQCLLIWHLCSILTHWPFPSSSFFCLWLPNTSFLDLLLHRRLFLVCKWTTLPLFIFHFGVHCGSDFNTSQAFPAWSNSIYYLKLLYTSLNKYVKDLCFDFQTYMSNNLLVVFFTSMSHRSYFSKQIHCHVLPRSSYSQKSFSYFSYSYIFF